MGGGLRNDEQLTVVFEIDGPVDETKFKQFNTELRALMEKYGVKKKGDLKWKK
jgi:hypothetical protein